MKTHLTIGLPSDSLAPGLEELANAVDSALRSEGVPFLFMGSLGNVLLCPGNEVFQWMRKPLVKDIDVVVRRHDVERLSQALRQAGYQEDVSVRFRFGATRRMFKDRRTGVSIDVFVGSISMSHALVPLWLRCEDHVLVPTDAVLERLQNVSLKMKDVLLLAALTVQYEVADDDVRGAISCKRISEVLGRDWGFWTTAKANLALLADQTRAYGVPTVITELCEQRWALLQRHLDVFRKPLLWRVRSWIGGIIRPIVEVDP